jgi:D-glycero-alpha-D-manno-heptose-7-phosphate kinase
MQILAKAPTRIDLAGGTLDIWPLYLLVGEAKTVNVAINLYATAKLESLSGKNINIISKDQNTTAEAEDLASLNHNHKLSLLTRLIHYFAPTEGFRLETDCVRSAE